MPAAFGDFLTPAGQHIAAAVTFRGELPEAAHRDAIGELGRLVSALARYLGDLPLPDARDLPGLRPPSPQANAAAEARTAWRRVARGIRCDTTARPDAHPVVRHLAAAADHLNAGRDLLQTHLTTPAPGTRAARSVWAPVVCSRPVAAALLGELADHARALAPWAAHLAMTGPPGPGLPTPERLLLHRAIAGLWLTAAAIEAAQRDHPPSAEARLLLAAIPASVPPPRRPPGDSESVAQLCEGITITAERLRHFAQAS